jgi:hypothetical protein
MLLTDSATADVGLTMVKLLVCEKIIICAGSVCVAIAVGEISAFSNSRVEVIVGLLISSEFIILSIVDDTVSVVDGISSGLDG